MTLLELLNVDLTKINDTLEADEKLSEAFDLLFDRIGFWFEGGRVKWHEADHDLNCEHCKEKITAH